jgi:uncharacterized protein (TIRG00374 family)
VTRKRWLSTLFMLARAALGVVLLVSVLKSGGAWESLKGMLAFVWLVAVLNAVPFVGGTIEALRLRVLFGAQGLVVPFWTGFRVVAIGTLFNLWIPGGTGGDVMKLYYLTQRNRGRGVEVATILLVDRAVALFALLVLILGLLVAERSVPAIAPAVDRAMLVVTIGLGVLIVGLLAMWSPRLRGSRVHRWMTTRAPFGRYLGRAADAVYAFRFKPGALAAAGLYSLAGHVLLAASFALAGTVLVPSVPSVLVATLSLLGLVANALPITPGGVGVGEAAAEALFRAIGVPGGAALVAAWRVGMIGVSVVGAAMYIFGDRNARLTAAAPPPLEKRTAQTHPLA